MVGGLPGELGVGDETKDAEPVVGGYQYYSVAGESLPVEERFNCRSGDIASAVKPNHNRRRRLHWPGGRPDVQLQAVFAADNIQVATLIARRPESRGIADSAPGLRWKRFVPAQVADRWFRKGDVLEDCYTIVGQAAAKLARADRGNGLGCGVQ